MLHISAVLIIIIGILDTIDGAIARAGKMETKIGALYDAAVDRLTEFAIFFGFMLSELVEDWLILLLFFLSYTISYIRARAESAGGLKKCDIGIAERSERLLLITLACILGIINIIYLKAAS